MSYSEYYDVTKEQVDAAQKELGIDHHGLVHYLMESGMTVGHIKLMTPYDKFKRYLEYEGIIGYTDAILDVLQACGYSVESSQ